MKILKIGIIALVLLFLAAQLIHPERTNPRVDASRAIRAQMKVPADVAGILWRACYDCHSHDTRWPWYSNVAPVSWLVADDVNHARQHVNFSDWAQYDKKKASDLLEDICDQISTGEMPLESYLLLHRDAKLTNDDVKKVCTWAEAQRKQMAEEAGQQSNPTRSH